MKKILYGLMSLSLMLSLVGCASSSNSGTTIAPTEEEKLPEEDDLVHIFILAGQSGARGKALISDLSNEQKEANYDVDIIADGLMMGGLGNIPDGIEDASISVLEPGYGDTNGEFGPELGMGETLASRFPKDGVSYKSIIVKYTACGSTFPLHWYSNSMINDSKISSMLTLDQKRIDKNGNETGPLTNNLYKLIDKTIENLKNEGFEAIIDGMAFLHGEQDAKFDDNMEIYESCLRYFIKDLREYVGNTKLPVVIPEALTNSAKHSNKLREIQRNVCSTEQCCTFIDNDGLNTNTFEPWHLNASSNYELGNKIAAELIAANDTRIVKEIINDNIVVSKGTNSKLPGYIKCIFENGYRGYLKVNATSKYDQNKLGAQEVSFMASTGEGAYSGKFNVEVRNEIVVDGKLDEEIYNEIKENKIENLGSIYVIKGIDGLYISAKFLDDELWTDGEAWHSGDMGQYALNDDFRIYLTASNAKNRYTICLSAANLLRIYDKNNAPSNANPSNNLIYNKSILNYSYRALTAGVANIKNDKAKELTLELYLGYDDLNITNPDDIKMCFSYANVVNNGVKRVTTENYLYNGNNIEHPELKDECYILINDLL